MPSIPFYYYISNTSHSLTTQSSLWRAPLPLKPLAGNGDSKPDNTPLVTYGDYFSGITSFLSQNKFEALRLSSESLCGHELDNEKINRVGVFLVKHGEYYHPARIETDIGGTCLKHVVNVAVSDAGLSFINKEFDILNYLDRSFTYSFIPKVFQLGEILSDQDRPIRMFIGEWFDGFCEFHLSVHPKNNKTSIIVWDDCRGNYFLNATQTMQLYEQSATILTSYFNPFTFEQIFSWHHAAGDFILKQEKDNLSLRLVTIRDYAPMIKNKPGDLGAVLDGLLIFFLNLSLRMGLDRLDGVGEYAWAGEPAVKGAVSGFFKGLFKQAAAGIIPCDLVESFKTYLSYFKPDDLFNWATAMIDEFHPNAPGLGLIKSTLHDYLTVLHPCIREILTSD